MQRRDFLKRTAVTTAGLLVPEWLAGGSPAYPMEYQVDSSLPSLAAYRKGRPPPALQRLRNPSFSNSDQPCIGQKRPNDSRLRPTKRRSKRILACAKTYR